MAITESAELHEKPLIISDANYELITSKWEEVNARRLQLIERKQGGQAISKAEQKELEKLQHLAGIKRHTMNGGLYIVASLDVIAQVIEWQSQVEGIAEECEREARLFDKEEIRYGRRGELLAELSKNRREKAALLREMMHYPALKPNNLKP